MAALHVAEMELAPSLFLLFPPLVPQPGSRRGAAGLSRAVGKRAGLGPGNRHKLSGRKVTKCCPKCPPTKEAGGFGILGLRPVLERCQRPLSVSLRMRLGCCAGRGGGPRHGDGASWRSGQPRVPWRKVMLWHLPLTGSPPGMARLGLSSHSAPVIGGLCSPGGTDSSSRGVFGLCGHA